tara:strand:- start:15446 stop:15940 length:495 start_codon:yes stop_codon:yes gene_type:complete
MILDYYFKRPLFYDYLISIIVIVVVYYSKYYFCFPFPKLERSITISSDLANVAFTVAGFILTLLTLLITFKSSSKISKESYSYDETVFNMFFVSNLYFETIKILKNCIKSLIVIAFIGYSLKLGLSKEIINYIFYYNIFALCIIVLTLYRCLLILNKILKMQEK